MLSDPKFKRDAVNRSNLAGGYGLPSDDKKDLLEMIMSVQPGAKTIHDRANSTMSPYTMQKSSMAIHTEVYNENQILAELIQQKALN